MIKTGKIISTDLEKLCGNRKWVFTCRDGFETVFEIKYDVEGVGGCFIRFK